MEEALQEQFKRVQSKLQDLLKKHSLALKDLERQQQLITRLQDEKKKDTETIRLLTEKQQILTAATGNMDPADKKAFEQTINRYIREIDKCIALLSE